MPTITVQVLVTAQKMKFSIEDFFSKYDQIRKIFCAVCGVQRDCVSIGKTGASRL